jgi:hypothetical protein
MRLMNEAGFYLVVTCVDSASFCVYVLLPCYLYA